MTGNSDTSSEFREIAKSLRLSRHSCAGNKLAAGGKVPPYEFGNLRRLPVLVGLEDQVNTSECPAVHERLYITTAKDSGDHVTEKTNGRPVLTCPITSTSRPF